MTAATMPTEPPSSQARIDANRRNAMKSTGPRTDEGKRRSRANALKHGLAAVRERIDLETETQAKRRASLADRFQVDDEVGSMLCDQAAYASVQFERAATMIQVAAETASLRAESVERWADDRRADVENLARKLDRDPRGVVSALMDDLQGVDWLIDRWQMLRHDAQRPGGWREIDAEVAMQLLATPADFRWLGPVAAFNELESPDDRATDSVDLCERMLRRLAEAREGALDLDEVRRQSTIQQVSDRHAPEVRRLRRYESTLHRRFRWMVELLAGPRAAEIAAEGAGKGAAGPPEVAAPAAPPVAQNEANPDARTKPIPPPTNLDAAPAGPGRPPQPAAGPARKHRPDPARLLERARKRRRGA